MADTIIVKDDEKPEEVEVKETSTETVVEIAEVAKEQASETIALAAQIAIMMDNARGNAEGISSEFARINERLDIIDRQHNDIILKLDALLTFESEETVIKPASEITVVEEVKTPEIVEEVNKEVIEEPEKRTNKKRRFI